MEYLLNFINSLLPELQISELSSDNFDSNPTDPSDSTDSTDPSDSSESSETIGRTVTPNNSDSDHEPDLQDVLHQHSYLREPTKSPDPITLAITKAIKNEDGDNRGFTQAMTNLLLKNPIDYNKP